MRRKATYYQEAWAYRYEQWQRAMAARLSRRLVLHGSAIASLGGASALNALLAACATDQAARRESRERLAEGQWKYSPYPQVEKYHWRLLPWSNEVYVGGTQLDGTTSPPARWHFTQVSLTIPGGRVMHLLLHNRAYGPGKDLDRVELQPHLASEWRAAPDLSYYDFVIPRQARYHDIPPVNGRPVTANDVKYVFDVYRTNSLFSEGLQDVERVEVIGGDTVRFIMKRPYLDFPFIVGSPQYWIFAPEHFEGPEEHWINQPIGSGPFKMVYGKFRDRWECVRHDGFLLAGRRDEPRWPGIPLPFPDRFIGVFWADDAARKAAFRSNQTDIITLSTTDELEDILATNPETVVQVSSANPSVHTKLVLQHNNPLFKDVRVRRALSMAIDRKAVIDLAYGGAAGYAHPVSWDSLELPAPPLLEDLGPYYQYNPEEARRLLAEAGYPDGFEVEWTVSSISDHDQVVAQQWAQVGVRVKFVQVESTVLTNLINTKKFPGIVATGATPGLSGLWESVNYFHSRSPINFGNIADPVMDELLERARSTVDPAEQVRLLRQVQEHELSQCNTIWTVANHRYTIWKPWFHYVGDHLRGRGIHFGNTNWAYTWIDDTAPGGRGGKRAT